jgi:autotransporter-associated beta strand protein
MKSISPRWLALTGFVAVSISAGFLASQVTQAQNTPDYYTGTGTGSLIDAENWNSKAGPIPTVGHDAVFTVTPGIRSLTTGDLRVGSFNVTASTGTFSIRNNTSTANDTHLTLGGAGNLGNSVSGTAADLLYAASGSIFNIRGDNGAGTGVLRLVLGQSGNFHIAGACGISSVISDGENHYGITKTGGGTLTLSGVNSYGGDTTVSEGSLVLTENAALKFAVTDASGNRLGGGATVILNGDFRMDLSAVSAAAASGSWQLVDVANLNESFGVAFRMVTPVGEMLEVWSEQANVWTRIEDGRTWTFSEATGVLVLSGSGGTAYDSWAIETHDLSVESAAFDGDHDGDGIDNGLEWILGGSGRTQSDPTCIFPEVGGSGSNGLTLVFGRERGSIAETELVVEWGGDPGNLTHKLVIGSEDIPVLGDEPGVMMDDPVAGKVTVRIPAGNAGGGKLFARLRATRR